MSLQGFQRALVDLTLAPGFFRALRRGESGLLDRYELNERERHRLLEISHQAGVAMNCSLSRGNRLELIVAAFPKTCTLLKPLLPGLLDELWERHEPDNYQLFGEENAFAAFLSRKISEGELRVEYLSEIFAYELACQDLAMQLETSTGPAESFETVVEFNHPPDQLLPPLERLVAPPPSLPKGVFPVHICLSESGLDLKPLLRGVRDKL
jgi:hypothetical protein